MTTLTSERKEVQLQAGPIRYREAGEGKPVAWRLREDGETAGEHPAGAGEAERADAAAALGGPDDRDLREDDGRGVGEEEQADGRGCDARTPSCGRRFEPALLAPRWCLGGLRRGLQT